MQTGAFTQYFDVAQVALYVFWLLFAGLIFHLSRENRREGCPVVSSLPGRVALGPPLGLAQPKTYLLHDGSSVVAPRHEEPEPEPKAVPSAIWPGAPLEPTGDPMIDGVGPAAWARRTDKADVMWETGEARIVPMRVDTAFSVAEEDPDPRGMTVIGCDGLVAGTVVDIWVDRAEAVARYLEVELPDGRRVLTPTPMVVVKRASRTVVVRSITSVQFGNVPGMRNPLQVTRLEEDKIGGYYAGGTLYATAERQESLL